MEARGVTERICYPTKTLTVLSDGTTLINRWGDFLNFSNELRGADINKCKMKKCKDTIYISYMELIQSILGNTYVYAVSQAVFAIVK